MQEGGREGGKGGRDGRAEKIDSWRERGREGRREGGRGERKRKGKYSPLSPLPSAGLGRP